MWWSLRLTLLRHWMSQFHVMPTVADATVQRQASLNPGMINGIATRDHRYTAPGLLTVETTGSTVDTAGMLRWY